MLLPAPFSQHAQLDRSSDSCSKAEERRSIPSSRDRSCSPDEARGPPSPQAGALKTNQHLRQRAHELDRAQSRHARARSHPDSHRAALCTPGQPSKIHRRLRAEVDSADPRQAIEKTDSPSQGIAAPPKQAFFAGRDALGNHPAPGTRRHSCHERKHITGVLIQCSISPNCSSASSNRPSRGTTPYPNTARLPRLLAAP